MNNLKQLLGSWYKDASAESLLNDIEDPKASGIGGPILAYLVKALKQQGLLPEDFHIYWIKYGENFGHHDHRVFRTEREALDFARKGPFKSPRDDFMLFEPYCITNEEMCTS